MNGEYEFNRPGRGLPPYLLCRRDSDSTLYSDGASRIFAPSVSDTSAKDTDNSLYSSDSFSVSSTTISFTDIDSCSVSNSVTSKIIGNYFDTGVDSVNDQRRTIECSSISADHSDSQLTLNSSVHDDDDAHEKDENVQKSNEKSMSGLGFLAGCLALASEYLENNNQVMNIEQNNENSDNCFANPENLIRSYVPCQMDYVEEELREKPLEVMDLDDTEESAISLPDPALPSVDYKNCCLWGDPRVSECGPSAQRYFQWKSQCYKFETLVNIDIRKYLKHLGVVKKSMDDNTIVNERNLIANRLLGKNILVDNSMSICQKHRSSFGIDWRDVVSTCNHPDHDPKSRTSTSDCRRANLEICSRIEGFPIGGRLCSKHRKFMSASRDTQDLISIGDPSVATGVSTFKIVDTREAMNRILSEANISPIRSQTRMALESQSKSSLRRLVSKLNRGAQILQEKLAESLAPGQKDELLEMLRQHSDAQKEQQANTLINNEIIIRLLSLLPHSMLYEDVMVTFGCSRHAIKCAHRIHDDNDYMLQSEKEPTIRQRADPNQIKHFVSWLVESNTLVSGTYGLTTLRMDTGEKVQLSKQILQSQKTHAIVSYKQYCDETDFEGLCTRKLFDILSSLKPEQQRIVAGLDDFVVEGVEAWCCLSNIVELMPIPQCERKRLLKQIEMAEQYQKTIHIGHCSENSDCITHCTTFGLSDPICPEQHRNCTQSHTFDCSDCVNIIRTIDEIQEKIEKLSNEEVKREAKYDFDNAAQHIIEWSRHNLRAAQQNDAKSKIISKMQDDEAFCTFDWGQKILPQEFRESQNTYFGKKGMSVLIGSFVWKNSSKAAATTTSNSTTAFNTESYILTLTNASQTDLDSLSGSEIIIKQLKEDHKHIIKLHKRTDNAGNFSSHSTPEIKKLICDRVSNS
ncbi:unnamed protein product [Rotaria magnacalcarata]|uniref:Uncharacterized protein n=1 Tax=Rotaria magnacalcarata TaxID=392030 RepID=A0A820GBA6_9BILA|nr:unnamed protein product [Rotaria magnacalcarata]